MAPHSSHDWPDDDCVKILRGVRDAPAERTVEEFIEIGGRAGLRFVKLWGGCGDLGLVFQAREILMEESNVQLVRCPVTVCDDIHGQFVRPTLTFHSNTS